MMDTTRHERKRIADELRAPAENARELARKLGLDPVEVTYWIVTHEEMNELIAYDGFQTRYPHWRWGMKYDRQEKQSRRPSRGRTGTVSPGGRTSCPTASGGTASGTRRRRSARSSPRG